MKTIKSLARFVLMGFVASAGLTLAQVATVFELTGTATASAAVAPGAPAAAGRTLRKGDAINQGETVRTSTGSTLVLSFTDGQIVALTANSTFTVSSYLFNQAEPAKSSMLLSLINGGMRAVTGLIGKARPQAVAYRAGNATIGIRGTDLDVGVDGDDLFAIANSGEAEVELEAQSLTTAMFAFPVTGNIAAMAATVEVPIQVAQRTERERVKIEIKVGNGFIRYNGVVRTGSSFDVREYLTRVSAAIQAAARGLQSEAVIKAVDEAVRQVNLRISSDMTNTQFRVIDSMINRINTAAQNSGAGGGTNCNVVSPTAKPAGCP